MNKMQKQLIAVVAVIIIVAAAAAAVLYTRGNNDNGDESLDTVTDVRGRTVDLPDSVNTVVCLSAGSVRLVSYFGADAVKMIVGIDNYDANVSAVPANYYKATYRIAYDIADKANVGSEENTKAIIETGADVIFSSITSVDELNTLQSATGIAVVAVAADGDITIQDDMFAENIKLVGDVLGKQTRADELLSGIEKLTDELSSYKSDSKVSANCYVGGMFYYMKGGLYMTTGNYLSFNLTNAVNVMSDRNNGNPYQTDKSTVMQIAGDKGIDYIFIDAMTATASRTAYEADQEDLASQVKAAEDGNLYSTLVYKYYGTNWEMELINAFYIGSVLDPTVYNYDVEDKTNEILALFFPDSNINYDTVVANQGLGLTKLNW
ncbi:MAG: ABC transporter substrate-binding protein [Candidatus Methanomethylophilus sp.]|nr:ABC transporter substrate-binding protein [Methanomethylophilus sp.]MDD3232655.1 ABC transporter substrate-binding protein [Methanomethylophilus sp.]MDD4222187.1 ABC transporter substrate-binding protein [Methanomethylophilus sp.]MDD4668519.1 ABC transporter substrate-binding protein [Methanomethylophilus sp.]